MKRRFIKKGLILKDNLVPIPKEYDDLIHYAYRLNLLNDIPLTYLLSDVSDLPPESIRFGIVDLNWTDAYIDGAFSIGRVCGEDGRTDKQFLQNYSLHLKTKLRYLDTPRMKRMHSNHRVKRSLLMKEKMNQDEPLENLSEISVVLIRSELVKLKKEIHYLGYKEDSQLKTLRIDKISDDLMICLFSGILDKFIIEEPLTGLSFGCREDKKLDIRSAKDEDFGTKKAPPLDGISIEDCIEQNGRINAQNIAKKIEKFMIDNDIMDYEPKKDDPSKMEKAQMSPSRFAYEMLAIPHRYAFLAGTQSEN